METKLFKLENKVLEFHKVKPLFDKYTDLQDMEVVIFSPLAIEYINKAFPPMNNPKYHKFTRRWHDSEKELHSMVQGEVSINSMIGGVPFGHSIIELVDEEIFFDIGAVQPISAGGSRNRKVIMFDDPQGVFISSYGLPIDKTGADYYFNINRRVVLSIKEFMTNIESLELVFHIFVDSIEHSLTTK